MMNFAPSLSASTAIVATLSYLGVPGAATRLAPVAGYVELRGTDSRVESDAIPADQNAVARSAATVVEIAPVISYRPTSGSEEVAGEIRSWISLNADWDGENSEAPNEVSLKHAANFALSMDASQLRPKPQLLANGNASLFWAEAGLIADLEFRPDGTITYYLESEEHGIHKGAAKAREDRLPVPFLSLLAAPRNAGHRTAA